MNPDKRKKNKKFFLFLKVGFLASFFFGIWFYFSRGNEENLFSQAQNKIIFLHWEQTEISYQTNKTVIKDFLQEHSIEISEKDRIYPDLEEKIFSGSHIYVEKARQILVEEGGEKKQFHTLQKTVGEAVRQISQLKVGEEDILRPNEETKISNGLEIAITHVQIEEEKKIEKIDFKIISNEDEKLGWQEKKVTQKGVKGEKEVVYKVVYHNDKEISRKKIREEVLKNPIEEIVTKGTYVKLGKNHSGFASWYPQPQHLKNAYPSPTGFYAANPWLPKGSFVKVTNKNNGKSIIARINDRGPFGPNRIIDLSKEAFGAIASLGAGIIDVKMEEVKN